MLRIARLENHSHQNELIKKLLTKKTKPENFHGMKAFYKRVKNKLRNPVQPGAQTFWRIKTKLYFKTLSIGFTDLFCTAHFSVLLQPWLKKKGGGEKEFKGIVYCIYHWKHKNNFAMQDTLLQILLILLQDKSIQSLKIG